MGYKLNIQERLQSLIGHDVIVNLLHDPHDEQGMPNRIPPGRLREVGEGYFAIQTISEAEGGFAIEGAEWLVSTRYVTSITHMVPDCAGCAVETASGKLG